MGLSTEFSSGPPKRHSLAAINLRCSVTTTMFCSQEGQIVSCVSLLDSPGQQFGFFLFVCVFLSNHYQVCYFMEKKCKSGQMGKKETASSSG